MRYPCQMWASCRRESRKEEKETYAHTHTHTHSIWVTLRLPPYGTCLSTCLPVRFLLPLFFIFPLFPFFVFPHCFCCFCCFCFCFRLSRGRTDSTRGLSCARFYR
jgi:hypothetical protein